MDVFAHKRSGQFITGYDRLNGHDSAFKQEMRNWLQERAREETESEAPVPPAIVFTFSKPPPVRPRPPPLRLKQLVPHAPDELVKLEFRDAIDEAFARMFRKDATRVDLVLRDLFALFNCNWVRMEDVFQVMHKHGIMVVSTLPLITCKLPILPLAVLETPWGLHFPYFETRLFGTEVVYRLSPVFMQIMQ